MDFCSDVAVGIGDLSDEVRLDNLLLKYNSVLSSVLDKHAPLKTIQVTVRKESPWYTSDIKSLKRECRKIERKWRRTKLEIHKQLYSKALKTVTEAITAAKRHYYLSEINSTDNSDLFKLSNKIMHKQKGAPLPQYNSALELATRFNKFFVEKILNIRQELNAISIHLSTSDSSMPEIPHKLITSVLDTFNPTDNDEIRKIIMSTKSNQCALDPIPTRLLKNCLEVLLPIITKIVNLSLSDGVMPTELKKALIFPLLKKLNLLLELLKNFRPVSNLAYISKVIERVVAKRMISHLDFNELHELLQSAYKRFHSCETALICVQNDILTSIDDGQCVLLVLLDLSAAFDTVEHLKLLQVLSDKFGIQGTALKWFESYLTDRKQCVVINGTESESWDIQFGVPQGSVLGPILFTLYTSTLGDILKKHGVKYHMYADDTQIYLPFNLADSEQAILKIQNCIVDIRKWMAANFLRLNDDKTEFMILGTPNMIQKVSSLQIVVGSDDISSTRAARNIGVIFDENLSMCDHVSNVCKAAWNQLRQIRHIRSYLTPSAAAILMHSFVISRLDNFNGLLFGLPASQIEKLQRIQNAAARIVSRCKKHEHITPILFQLHWLPVKYRIQYKILLLTFKSLNCQAPSYIQDAIQISRNTRTLRSRSQLLLNVPKIRLTKYGGKSFSYSAPHLWNSLPDNVRNYDTINIFKSRLKTHLFSCAY